MKIATWNVNSIRSRLERLLALLERHQPDVLCLQELKATDDVFPRDEITQAGYYSVVYGQKTYNGVAILSRSEPSDIRCGLEDGVDDPQARLVSAEIDGVRVLSAYIPNGSSVDSDKFAYKLQWLSRLRQLLDRAYDPEKPLAICGDFNVAIDDLDVAEPNKWADSVLCVPQVREALATVTQWGLVDTYRERHPEGGLYSWWDYRQLAFPKNNGLRIDHVFATAPLAQRCVAAEIDRDERKGQKPSDHAPVIVEFAQG
ncbi:MAG: exodeoxyribonuclease III [candidate division Zixibacteria bacterium]|nr:exodeoxyribonuclease III [candidate division Zixibacteria bacterium]